MFCPHVPQSAKTPGIWNPLPRFDDVQQDHQLGNIQPLRDFYRAARSGTAPGGLVGHALAGASASIRRRASRVGQTYVTGLINTIMHGPDWKSTAIFLAWDDWGGFYDHVKPPRVDGDGLRPPRAGARDQPVRQAGLHRPPDRSASTPTSSSSRTTSCTANGSTRAPTADPTPRPDVRENAKILGNLVHDFNFDQKPRPPLLLPLHPPFS